MGNPRNVYALDISTFTLCLTFHILQFSYMGSEGRRLYSIMIIVFHFDYETETERIEPCLCVISTIYSIQLLLPIPWLREGM